jgi:phospholipid/cholesterol/gamma-HCH transport system permease protein
MNDTPSLTLQQSANKSGASELSAKGSWKLSKLEELRTDIAEPESGSAMVLNGKEVSELDTSGAMMLLKIAGGKTDLQQLKIEDFSGPHGNIIELVRSHLKGGKEESLSPVKKKEKKNIFIGLGKKAENFGTAAKEVFEFIGHASIDILENFIKPRSFRIKELFAQADQVFLNAIPVIILVTAMIGIVIAYISASQIEKYGAGIFIVDGISLAMLRELSPVIVAIVVAGRSGSAFTAQIGTMKMNEEVDAITTLGLSPFKVLVVPRILAILITMPLLVFIGDIVGIGSGMLIADLRLGITPSTFIDRFQAAVPVRWAWLGFIKAPVFAFMIAVIGCRNGMNTENNARSVGLNTTATVVQSIVAVIILDAIFAVAFQELQL